MRYRRIRFPAVGSTNDIVLDAAQAGVEPGLVVQAGIQRAGKGRRTRDWTSPEGGLWVSVLLNPDVAQTARGLVPLAVGCACCEALDDLGIDVGLRWPNDLILEDRKLGGILVESRTRGQGLDAIVAGIGINVANEAPTSEAASLRDVLASPDPEDLLEHLLDRLPSYEDGLAEGRAKWICQRFMRHAWGIGRELLLDGEPRTPKEIAVDGALIVEDPSGGIEICRSGSLRLP